MTWVRKGLISKGIDQRAQVPVVDIHNQGFWRIYFSHRDEKNHSYTSYIDVEPGNPKNILNISQKPVLSPGRAGELDASGAMATSILTIEGKKYLYYIAWTQRKDIPYHNTTSLAIANVSDTTNFKKIGPILSPDLCDPGYSGTFYPFFDSKQHLYIGYYLSCTKWEQINDKMEPFYNLKKAISSDAVYWKKIPGVAVDLKKGEGGISQASVLFDPKSKVYKMFFSVRGERAYRESIENSYRIESAESFDTDTWKRCDDSSQNLNPTRIAQDWDGQMVCYPCIVEWSGKKYLFYNGNSFGQTGIGYAIWE